MRILTLDIESIPSQRDDLADLWDVEPPGNMSKPETIAKWREEKYEAALAESHARTALDTSLAEVLCIGYAWDDGEPRTEYRTLDGDEGDLIEGFADALTSYLGHDHQAPRIVGHNIIGYDLPLLWHRAVACGVRLPRWIRPPHRTKPWDAVSEFLCDTSVAWTGDWRNHIKLDKLARILGVGGKGDITGADVWPMAQCEQYEEIAAYCKSDVELTRAVYRALERHL